MNMAKYTTVHAYTILFINNLHLNIALRPHSRNYFLSEAVSVTPQRKRVAECGTFCNSGCLILTKFNI